MSRRKGTILPPLIKTITFALLTFASNSSFQSNLSQSCNGQICLLSSNAEGAKIGGQLGRPLERPLARQLWSELDAEEQDHYGTVKRKIIDLLQEDDKTFGKRLLELVNDGYFVNQIGALPHHDCMEEKIGSGKFKDSMESLSYRSEESILSENPYDSSFTLDDYSQNGLDHLHHRGVHRRDSMPWCHNELIAKNSFEENPLTEFYKGEMLLRKKHKSKLKRKLRKLDAKVEVELLRLMKMEINNHTGIIGSDRKLQKMIYIKKSLKLFSPILVSSVIFFLSIISITTATTLLAPGFIMSVIIAFLSYGTFFTNGIYFIYKLIKLDRMKSVFEKFRESHLYLYH
ncbi:hypothetical protein PCYB_074360 [Plasmodium cynomolgi strain B]|uniref:Pv-fam-d protein n=1 Tax=Plasmodium cynomolgi (strain B) TaxID=1120755 RepID=K6UUP7_PLACD|nr:hypothetical protein PCYB_074360 [Plasmodium cynomolgi strain B]GAB65935.1 hypothetical protein PCYB_074360 [Plasmodium cynomolgi strain B]